MPHIKEKFCKCLGTDYYVCYTRKWYQRRWRLNAVGGLFPLMYRYEDGKYKPVMASKRVKLKNQKDTEYVVQ